MAQLSIGNYSFYTFLRQWLLKNNDEQDNIFLRANAKMGFFRGDLETFTNPYKTSNHSESVYELIVNILGIHGANSNLPSFVLDKLLNSYEEGQSLWILFFDFLHHHILWLLYDVLSKRGNARSFRPDFSDSNSQILFAFLGIPSKSYVSLYLAFAPLFSSFRKPKHQIVYVLQQVFDIKHIELLEYIHQDIAIDIRQVSYLGVRNSILSKNFILGRHMHSIQTKCAILLRDISYKKALCFFQDGALYKDFKDTCILLTDNKYSIDLYLQIRYDNITRFVLSHHQSILGKNTILGKPKKTHFLRIVELVG